MNTKTRRAPWVWGLVAALFAAAVGCGGYLASGEVVYASVAPPPERVEVIGPAPGPQYLWIDGYWRWGGASYDWVPGRWVAADEGHRHWKRGRWHHDRRGWFYEDGHWR